MSTMTDLFPGFASHWIDTQAGRIFARVGGEGPPLVLLHGFPQTHVMWHAVAPALADRLGVHVGDTVRIGMAQLRIIGLIDMAMAIRDQRPHRASGALALHVLEVLEAFEKSSRTGQFITLSTRCERPAPVPQGADESVFC
jgi:pimeloyl-ACP methyl ester carboxylesterase